MSYCTKAPTEKQIQFVELICKVLKINDFPTSSKEFTKRSYSQFISAHILDFHNATEEIWYSYPDEEWCYEHCINDVWTEMF